MWNKILMIILAIFVGALIGTVLSIILIRIRDSIKKTYYISFAISENNAITIGRTVMTTTGKITTKDIVELEESWSEEQGLEHVIVQNIYHLQTYIDFKTLFMTKKKIKKLKTEKQVQAGPRLMR